MADINKLTMTITRLINTQNLTTNSSIFWEINTICWLADDIFYDPQKNNNHTIGTGAVDNVNAVITGRVYINTGTRTKFDLKDHRLGALVCGHKDGFPQMVYCIIIANYHRQALLGFGISL